MTGPSACSQLTERVVVVGSYTRMFLGPLRGTESGNIKKHEFVCAVHSTYLYPSWCIGIHCFSHCEWSLNTLAQVLTCLSSITDSGSFAITVQGNHSNIIGSVWEQLLQQGSGPWHHDLHRDKSGISALAACAVLGH